jgi:predicted MFS family arabinose efflux permease
VFLIAFVLYEHRAKDPMVDMAYFRNPAFSTSTGCMILVFLSMYGIAFLITQYLQLVQGYSAVGAALRVAPTAVLMVIVGPQTPRLSARLGANRAVAVGMSMAALALFTFTTLERTSSYVHLLIPFCVFSFGIGLTMSPMTAAIMSAVPPRRAGAGSAMNDATRELGAALGVAVLGSVVATHYSHSVAAAANASLTGSAASEAKSSIASALDQAKTLPANAGKALTAAADHAFLGGMHIAAIAAGVLSAVAAVLVLRYLPHTLRHRSGEPATELNDGEMLAMDVPLA